MTFRKPYSYPRFLIIKSFEKEKPIALQSVFLISKFLEGTIGESYKAKKQRAGELLVEVSSQQQATKLLSQSRMLGLNTKVTSHRSLNSSQGVILEPDLADETEADLLEGLRNQGVAAARHITIRRDNKGIPTRHIILTFDRIS